MQLAGERNHRRWRASGIPAGGAPGFARTGAGVLFLGFRHEAGERVAADAARGNPGPVTYRLRRGESRRGRNPSSPRLCGTCADWTAWRSSPEIANRNPPRKSTRTISTTKSVLMSKGTKFANASP